VRRERLGGRGERPLERRARDEVEAVPRPLPNPGLFAVIKFESQLVDRIVRKKRRILRNSASHALMKGSDAGRKEK
jgi:hypothetical protein